MCQCGMLRVPCARDVRSSFAPGCSRSQSNLYGQKDRPGRSWDSWRRRFDGGETALQCRHGSPCSAFLRVDDGPTRCATAAFGSLTGLIGNLVAEPGRLRTRGRDDRTAGNPVVAEGPGDQLQKASAAAESQRRRFADGLADGGRRSARVLEH